MKKLLIVGLLAALTLSAQSWTRLSWAKPVAGQPGSTTIPMPANASASYGAYVSAICNWTDPCGPATTLVQLVAHASDQSCQYPVSITVATSQPGGALDASGSATSQPTDGSSSVKAWVEKLATCADSGVAYQLFGALNQGNGSVYLCGSSQPSQSNQVEADLDGSTR